LRKKDANEAQILYVLSKIKKDYKLKDSDIICLLFEVIFDSKEIIQLLKKKGGLLKKFCKTPIAQKSIFACLEGLISRNEELLQSTSVILDELYDYEIFTDEVFKRMVQEKEGKICKRFKYNDKN